MNDDINSAVDIVENQVRDKFEEAWLDTVQEEPNYRILVWGSTVEDDKDPNDLDLIFEYTNESISPSKENSIESIVRSNVYAREFSKIDPLVVHYVVLPSIISKSKNSAVYSIDESGWVEFD